TAGEIADDPALRAELTRRGERPPVLRLVWPIAADPPEGFDTEVRLPLRAGVEADALLAASAAQASDLLLALPWRRRIDIGDRVLHREGSAGRAGDQAQGPVLIHDGARCSRWRVVRRAGRFPPDVLAGLGPEARAEWSLCWALPVDAGGIPQPLRADVL